MNHHVQECPLCARPMPVETRSDKSPPAMPCSSCWIDIPAARRVTYLRAHRRVPPDERSLRHRDPVTYAPPTLLAYVEHLEAIIAAQARDLEALLPDEEDCASYEDDADAQEVPYV